MGLFSFGKKANGEVVALCDIGASRVSIALIRHEGPLSDILYTTSTPVPFQKTLSTERLLDIVSVALHDATETCARAIAEKKVPGVESLRRVERIMCVLSSPWYVSHTTRFVAQREKPITVTGRFLDILISKDKAPLERENAVFLHTDTEMIERKVLQVSLNGYPTFDPSKKTASHVEAIVYTAFSSRPSLSRFTDSLRHFFHDTPIAFHSFPLASFFSTVRLFPEEKQFLTVHVTGEVTDVSVVRNGRLEDIVSFPVGKNTLLRILADSTSTGDAESLTLMRFFSEKNTLTPQIESALLSAQNAWIRAFTETVEPLLGASFVSPHAFLIADEDVRSWFTDTLSVYKKEHNEKVFFHVTTLTRDHLAQSLRFAQGLDGSDTVPLLMEALATPFVSDAALPLPQETPHFIHKSAPRTEKNRATIKGNGTR